MKTPIFPSSVKITAIREVYLYFIKHVGRNGKEIPLSLFKEIQRWLKIFESKIISFILFHNFVK